MPSQRRLLVRPEDLAPSHDDFEVIGAFNPGVADLGDEVVLLVRVAEQPRARRPGYTALPRWRPETGLEIDWIADSDIEPIDPRVVRRKDDRRVRLTFISHLRVMRSRDGISIDTVDAGRFVPQMVWEEFGVEDPRITAIDGRWYFTYVAVSQHGVSTALASTGDFVEFTRHGILFCPENKDVVLFPERIGGSYAALHRPNAATAFTAPEMWLARSPDLIHWGQHEPLHGGRSAWEMDRVGAGTPPIRVGAHWLAIYHGSAPSRVPGQVGVYSAGALLLNGDNPAVAEQKTDATLLAPEAPFEREGFVPNVVFPTGIVARGARLLIYYGAADTFTAVADLPRRQLLSALRDLA